MILASLLALAGVACGDDTVPDAQPSPQPPAEPPPAPSEDHGPPVPQALDFSAPALGGGLVVGAELAGQGVALWFFAPW